MENSQLYWSQSQHKEDPSSEEEHWSERPIMIDGNHL